MQKNQSQVDCLIIHEMDLNELNELIHVQESFYTEFEQESTEDILLILYNRRNILELQIDSLIHNN